MNLPLLSSLDLNQKKVIVRADLDFDPEDSENLRLKALIPTLNYIKEKGGQIILLGHRGRPDGKRDEKLSLMPFKKVFEKWDVKLEENLRFNEGEEKNDPEFAKKLASLGEIYVNEAFAASHRKHASIVGLPKLLPHAAGLRFAQEVENLSKVLESPKRPVIAIISGVKDDKLAYIEGFLNFADKILVGGRLPEYIFDASPLRKNPKILVAGLIADKEDISLHSVEAFEKEVEAGGTIVVAGPIGKFEDEGHRQGTKRVFEKIAHSNAFKVAGGGDTEEALKLLNLTDKFDWISVGGGAALEFLSKGTLPGIASLTA